MWAVLVSEKAPVSTNHVDHLEKMLKMMEEANLKLRQELEIANNQIKTYQSYIAEETKQKGRLQKQVTSMTMSVKLEKKASEGLAKKAGALDIECVMLKEERKVMLAEQVHSRYRVKELETMLCDDRSKRLRDIHENELLRKRNAELEARETVTEADALKVCV